MEPTVRLVSEFEHPGVLNLTHVAVDRGSIYLAGGNVLYQLDQVLIMLYNNWNETKGSV